jgi:hypothetical protein
MTVSKGQIIISFEEGATYEWSTPVPIEVLNERLERVANEVVSLSGSKTLEVEESGLYLVRAELPSGENVATTVRVSPEVQAKATLTSSEKSPRQTLTWAYMNRNLRRMSGIRLLEPPEFAVAEALRTPNVTVKGISRIKPGLKKWQMTPLDIPYREDSSMSLEDPRLIKAISIEAPKKGSLSEPHGLFPLYVRWSVRTAAEEEHVSYVAVPTDYVNGTPPYEAMLLFVRADTAVGASDRVRALVRAVSPGAEALLGYLAHGSLGAARRISKEVVADAVDYLREKREGPFAACIAGYFLLRAGHGEKQDWMRNLANWFPMIADGAVIYATSLLRAGGPIEREEARRYLIEAVSRGIPVYTVGLRLLFDGLRSLLEERGSDEELSLALGRIRYVAAFTDWSAHTTTFSLPRAAKDAPLGFEAGGGLIRRILNSIGLAPNVSVPRT